MPYLTVEVRHDPVYMNSPPYQAIMSWCAANTIPLVTGWLLRVYDESPVRAELDIIDLDPDTGEWVYADGATEPTTHTETYTCTGLPIVRGYVSRGGSTAP